ncbi:hypothetical protein HZA55_10485 [Candidatus Poribacteria bacterium]|nr:hypothetical protein [Candidatus Poribacteria bacterium]
MARDISDEEVGIRSFHLRRDRAVEQSIEKIRQSLNKNWNDLTFNDTHTLHWVLGEVWSFIARDNWNNIAFSLLTFDDVKKILVIADKIIHHNIIGGVGLDQAYKILETKKVQNLNE